MSPAPQAVSPVSQHREVAPAASGVSVQRKTRFPGILFLPWESRRPALVTGLESFLWERAEMSVCCRCNNRSLNVRHPL